MAYHNVRGKDGRFAPKKKTKARVRVTRKKTTVVNTPKIILNGFLADSSGSMSGKESSVISGFNELLQQGIKDTKATGVINKNFIAFFGSSYKEYAGEVTGLQGGSSGSAYSTGKVGYYSDMGSTALWESAYKFICKLEQELKSNPNAKVILTIFTDGEENHSSREWADGTKLKGIIEQKQKEGWVINFIGAGSQAAIQKVASTVGIFASNAVGYENTARGTKVSMDLLTKSRSSYSNKVAAGTDKNIGFFSND